jgi:hypothetical protein
MIHTIEVQTIEVSAQKFFSIMLYLSEEEYEQVQLDTKAFGDSIVQAVEASDGS